MKGIHTKEDSRVRKIAFVGGHLPRKCGIATFTSDLLAAVATAHPLSQCLSVSVNDIKGGYEYPEVVRFEIEEQDLSSYLRAADFLNISNVDIVCLQHEFGIFGGPAGSHILALLRELRMPVVTTLHTVLREPKADQRRVMDGLISLSTRLVVMAERGRQMLQGIYQAPPAKIDLIPHGIPDVGFVDPTYFKDQFGVEGRVVLLTFGLLSPNKGIEHALNALPHILAEFPEVVYIVLGATHPNELREHGEAYLGNGDGTLQSPSSYPDTTQSKSLVTADFNGDGKLDLTTDTGTVLLGKGDGTFAPAAHFFEPSGAKAIATADFNGDGKQDLAVGNFSSFGGVFILLGKGYAKFDRPTDYSTPGAAFSVAVGDFNADGNPDLAVAANSTVSILLGNGDGTFQPR
jgi:hypothetical protein